jgi:hypothetical protein
MKINLIYGQGDVLHTHLNINPFATTEELENYLIRADVKNLDPYVDDAEATEIIASDVIDYLPLNEVNNVIDHWIKKLRYNGIIVIGGTDLTETSKAIAQYRLDVTLANQLLHGNQSKPYLIKRVTMTALGLSNYLQEKHKLKILKKRINDYRMIIEAQRCK